MSNGFHNLDASTQAAMHDSMYDDQERQETRRKELIEKFPSGWDRYNKEPLFRNIIEVLMRGGEPFDVIDQLIEMNKGLSDRISEFLTLHAFPAKIEFK